MIKLITGGKGSGKTKQMVDLINESVKTTSGNIVCIEKSMQLTYELDHKCRLIDMDDYHIAGEDMLYGFVCGILAGNYDIEEVYVDGILKVLGKDLDALGRLLGRLEEYNGDNCRFIITVSADDAALPDAVKRYL